jgi:hypothetical protein
MIECKEQMPEKGKEVLVRTEHGLAVAYWDTYENGEVHWSAGHASIDGEFEFDAELRSAPTHWREIPENL